MAADGYKTKKGIKSDVLKIYVPFINFCEYISIVSTETGPSFTLIKQMVSYLQEIRDHDTVFHYIYI